MAAPVRSLRVVRFGTYEARLASGELYKDGHKIKLQDQPFQVLATLLERPGELISRRRRFTHPLSHATVRSDTDTREVRDSLSAGVAAGGNACAG